MAAKEETQVVMKRDGDDDAQGGGWKRGAEAKGDGQRSSVGKKATIDGWRAASWEIQGGRIMTQRVASSIPGGRMSHTT